VRTTDFRLTKKCALISYWKVVSSASVGGGGNMGYSGLVLSTRGLSSPDTIWNWRLHSM
jgi:hypothetical protein